MSILSNISCPVEIIFENKITHSVSDFLSRGKSVLLTSKSFAQSEQVKKILDTNGEVDLISSVSPNPTLDYIDKLGNELYSKSYKNVIALGGGSVIDTSKALSVILSQKKHISLETYFYNDFEVDFENKLFLIAIPTTSGTGAEVTPFATIWDNNKFKKLSLNNEFLYPDIALLDPLNTLTLNYENTLFPGLDAISHALESIWNQNCDDEIFANSMLSLELMNKNFFLLLENLNDLKLRSEVQKASTIAGISISKTKTALAHSVSYPLTLNLGIPHGLACSFTLFSIFEKYKNKNKFIDKNIDFFDEFFQKVNNLNLRQFVCEIANKDEIMSYVPEMSHPDRIKNFFVNIENKDIKSLIDLSIS